MTIREQAQAIVEQEAVVQEAWKAHDQDRASEDLDAKYWQSLEDLSRLHNRLLCGDLRGNSSLYHQIISDATGGEIKPEDVNEWLWTIREEIPPQAEPPQEDPQSQYPREVAYQIPGLAWRRKVIRNQKDADRFFKMIEEEGAEVRFGER